MISLAFQQALSKLTRRNRETFCVLQRASNAFRTTTTMTKVRTMMTPTTTTTTKRQTPKAMVDIMRERMKKNNDDPIKVWESLWYDGITPWDLGGPTKALISEIQYKSLRPTITLVPGCGSGYDLVSLGRFLDSENHTEQVYTIIGLELSATSLHRARRIVKESIDNDGPFQHTTLLLYEGDFFQNPSLWSPFFSTNDNSHNSLLPKLPCDQQFTFIFDYTFFCAIPPRQRTLWGQQMQELLAPDGKLLTLMFPYHPSAQKAAEAQTRGPPYALSLDVYQATLDKLTMETPLPYASLATASKRQGQEVVGWWYKAKL